MKIGAVVVAAGLSSRMQAFKPMLELAGSTIIQQTIGSLGEAGIRDITVVVGHKGNQLKKHLAGMGLGIVENPNYRTGDMFGSVCLGLKAMGAGWDGILFLPGDLPLFAADTATALCQSMKNSPCSFISPVYQGKKGHPILLHGSMIERLLAYEGEDGLRGAMEVCPGEHRLIEVDDKGVLLDADRPEDYERLQVYASELARREPVSFCANLALVRGTAFWDGVLQSLLESIETTGSLNKSCEQVGISYSKGWTMIRQAQYRLGILLLMTNTGGRSGGGSWVTPEARLLMEAYCTMQQEMNRTASKLFAEHFGGFFGGGDL